ncbi:CAMK protein kinase [Pseudogymnoascus sp. 24MN13]|nr:CAMK protein kinase [Pseudogymnoascus sp. 24MN13]
MDDDATQPATQLVMDPRRLGDHVSDLEDDDLTDIFCILHPVSLSALNAVTHIGDVAPEHTVSRASAPIKIRGGPDITDPNTMDLAEQGLVSRDIALRLSAKLIDPLAGYTFGRNTQRCDFVLRYPTVEGTSRISNVHFRIFITIDGIVMIEDQSTNGTVVEGKKLRFKDKENDAPHKHTLSHGSLVSLSMNAPDEDLRFVVRIPQREGIYEDIFSQNLADYFARMSLLRKNRDAQVKTDVAGQAPDIFAVQNYPGGNGHGPDQTLINRRPKEWRGGVKYNKSRVIGKGAFATVYMISAKYDGTVYAAKELEKRRFVKNGILDQKVDQEMRIMSSIKHPNIVQYIEHVDWEDHLYIIMDYVPEGDLGSLVSSRGTLSEVSTKTLAKQMFSALKYLHDKGITHRDIKPDNILVQGFDPFHVKLTDFGLSKRIENEDTFMRTFCGTLLYCAPEVYSEYLSYFLDPADIQAQARIKSKKFKRYDQAVDLWSLAGVLFYCLSGSPPYPAKSGTTYQQLLHSIMRGPLDIRPLQLAGVSEEGIDMIKSMLHNQAPYRPSIEELEESQWINPGSTRQADVRLEHTASQLSIQDQSDSLGTSDEIDLINAMVDTKNLEIPSSFISGDEGSSGNSEKFAVNNTTSNQPRLFGEVNLSALRSSGVIPQERLNLPLSDTGDNNTAQSSFVNVDAAPLDFESQNNFYQSSILPEQHGNMPPSLLGTGTAPSLLGAESMVGNLAMNSPSPTTVIDVASPQETFTGAVPDFRESMKSLRRQRDPNGDDEPLAKRAKSSRAIDIELSKTVFWDARDRSTHHLDYPVMRNSEYQEAKALAKMYGEEFKHGESVFETVVGAYRRSASATPEPPTRAQSEPVAAGGPAKLNRDERGFSEDRAVLPTGSWINGVPSPEISQYLPGHSKAAKAASKPEEKPVISNDVFQPPHRILAKLVGTSDSPGTKPSACPPTDKDNAYAFYIATKASHGIKVNGIVLPSHDCRSPQKSPAKYWGKLQHGDVVDVWTQDSNSEVVLRFRFDCFWGESKEPRRNGQFFSAMKEGPLKDELESFCQWEESAFFQAKYDAEVKAKGIKEGGK